MINFPGFAPYLLIDGEVFSGSGKEIYVNFAINIKSGGKLHRHICSQTAILSPDV